MFLILKYFKAVLAACFVVEVLNATNSQAYPQGCRRVVHKTEMSDGRAGLRPLIVSYIANLIDLSAEDVLRSVLEIPICYLLSRLTLLLVTVRNS